MEAWGPSDHKKKYSGQKNVCSSLYPGSEQQFAFSVVYRSGILKHAEEGVLINDDLNALPPQQKCLILPPSALGERRGSTFVAATEPHNDDVTPVMRVSTTTHRTQASEQIAPMRG